MPPILSAEKQADYLPLEFTHTAFFEGVRGNHSLASKEWFPRNSYSPFSPAIDIYPRRA